MLDLADDSALYELRGTIWRQSTVDPSTASTVPHLIRLLDDADANTALVLDVLSDLAPAGDVPAGLPVYLRLLAAHPDPDVRVAAAGTVGALGPDVAGGAVAALRQAAGGDTGEIVRLAAINALAARGEAVEEYLGNSSPLARLGAALVLARTGDALPETVSAVLERDTPACLEAIGRLPNFDDDPLIWVLRELEHRRDLQTELVSAWLRHPDPVVREGAAYAAEEPLMHWRPAAGLLAPLLAGALSDPAPKVRYWAVRNLSHSGRITAAHADDLAATGELSAMIALAGLGDPRADAYLAGLLRSLPDADLERLGAAIEALGPWATGCRAVILDAVEVAPAGPVRTALIRAAQRMDLPVGDLVPMLRREASTDPLTVAGILGDLGPDAADALPELAVLRKSADAPVRIRAARAQWRIAGDDLLAVLRAEIAEPEALTVLAELGPAGAPLAELLPPLFTSTVRAAVAYWHVTGDAAPVVPVLLRHLTGGPSGLIAVECLGTIGPAAEAAVPVLRAAVESPYRLSPAGYDGVRQDEAWRDACAAALARIG
ncbi:HEAT repeat domain-containing protein [Actinoplanes sp. NBC_00393]|uniref:HEAT repeat domain-containing protein n=1 Tax=Actinoplanes sp. NBC_00393 TaxID=2975953 RepID=UPI002E1D41CD